MARTEEEVASIKLRPLRRARSGLCLSALLTAGLGLAACGGGGGPDGGAAPPPRATFFDTEVSAQKGWSELSPELAASDGPTAEAPATIEEIDGTQRFQCSVRKYSLTDTPREFVSIDPDRSVIWVGSLVQGRSHYEVGALRELPIRERGPLKLSISLLRADNAREVPVASKDAVDSAIGDLVERAAAAGHRASSDVYYESKEAHSSTQVSLKLGLSGEYLGGAAESRLEIDKVGAERTLVAYFIQRAFTVSMESPARPSDVVGAGFTSARLQELRDDKLIGDDNPPLFISSMTYGRILMYKMTARYSSERIAAAIEASYRGPAGGIAGFSEAELQKTLDESRVEVATFGGDVANVEALIRSGRLREYFTGDTSLTAMRPISFELRRLRDRETARITRTTEYAVKDCAYVGDTRAPIGETMRVRLVRVEIPDACDGGLDAGDIFGRFDVLNTDAAGNAFTHRIFTINRGSSRAIASGNRLEIGVLSPPLTRYYGKTFAISGELLDADSGLNGADDIVGRWNANAFSIATLRAGSYRKTATTNCGGANPTLTYELVFDSYVY